MDTGPVHHHSERSGRLWRCNQDTFHVLRTFAGILYNVLVLAVQQLLVRAVTIHPRSQCKWSEMGYVAEPKVGQAGVA